MELEIDEDVKAVAEFMQTNIAASRLTGVASSLSALAPVLWGRYAPEPVHSLSLAHPQGGTMRSETSQSIATGLEPIGSDVDGCGSEAAGGAALLK